MMVEYNIEVPDTNVHLELFHIHQSQYRTNLALGHPSILIARLLTVFQLDKRYHSLNLCIDDKGKNVRKTIL